MSDITSSSELVNLQVVPTRSHYLAVNIKNIPEDRQEVLSGSIGATKKMINLVNINRALVAKLTGTNHNNSDYNTKINEYWNTFYNFIPGQGLTLEKGFNYNTEELYTKYKAKFNALYKKYVEGSVKETVEKQREIYIHYAEELLFLAEEMNQLSPQNVPTVGSPINEENYILYLYCLFHSQVAKKHTFVDLSANIRFYLSSPEEIKIENKTKFQLSHKAMEQYMDISDKVEAINSLLYVLELPIDNTDKEINLSLLKEFMLVNPTRFLEASKDKNLNTKALIQQYLHAGILTKISNTSTIIDSEDGSLVIGANLEEAVSFFALKDAVSTKKQNEYQLKLKAKLK